MQPNTKDRLLHTMQFVAGNNPRVAELIRFFEERAVNVLTVPYTPRERTLPTEEEFPQWIERIRLLPWMREIKPSLPATYEELMEMYQAVSEYVESRMHFRADYPADWNLDRLAVVEVDESLADPYLPDYHMVEFGQEFKAELYQPPQVVANRLTVLHQDCTPLWLGLAAIQTAYTGMVTIRNPGENILDMDRAAAAMRNHAVMPRISRARTVAESYALSGALLNAHSGGLLLAVLDSLFTGEQVPRTAAEATPFVMDALRLDATAPWSEAEERMRPLLLATIITGLRFSTDVIANALMETVRKYRGDQGFERTLTFG